MNPAEKRLAIAVPDHALSYIGFEGIIREGSYGAGKVFIWDKGDFETSNEAAENLEKGKLEFTMFGEKLRGNFTLLKMKSRSKQWLLIKSRDNFADPNWKLETVLASKNK